MKKFIFIILSVLAFSLVLQATSNELGDAAKIIGMKSNTGMLIAKHRFGT